MKTSAIFAFAMSLLFAVMVIIFGIQLTGSYIREEARKAASEELDYRMELQRGARPTVAATGRRD